MNDIAFTVSYEIRSPKRGSLLKDAIISLTPLLSFCPTFISIANHQPEEKYLKGAKGELRKVIADKYPATYFFAIALQRATGVEVVPYLLCNELEPDLIDDLLLGFQYSEIKRVMALRGDRISNTVKFPNRYTHSSELIRHIIDFNNFYCTKFKIGVAGYPDIHPTAISSEHDLFFLKSKTSLGASFVTTQMFLDNQRFYDFLTRCSGQDISATIYPGLKLIVDSSNLIQYKKRFNLEIPKELELLFLNIQKNDCNIIGEQWLFHQCDDLIKNGQGHLHFYIFSDEDINGVFTVLKKLKEQYPR